MPRVGIIRSARVYLDAVPLSPQVRERLDRLIALGESRRSPFDGRPSKSHRSLPLRVQAALVRSPGAAIARPTRSQCRGLADRRRRRRRRRTARQPASGTGQLVSAILPVSDDLPIATGAGGNGSISGAMDNGGPSGLRPAAAGTFATPAPAAVANEPALTPHEVFGFAPYWALADSSQFDLVGAHHRRLLLHRDQPRWLAGQFRPGLGRLPEPELHRSHRPRPRGRGQGGDHGERLLPGVARSVGDQHHRTADAGEKPSLSS